MMTLKVRTMLFILGVTLVGRELKELNCCSVPYFMLL
jgi:hypothetical protein